jgi:hypothetical protein
MKPANTALKKAALLGVFIILLSDHVRFAQILLKNSQIEQLRQCRSGAHSVV